MQTTEIPGDRRSDSTNRQITAANTLATVDRSPPRFVAGLRLTKLRGSNLLKILVHIAALLPLVVLIWDGVHNQLTVNPIQEITDRTGRIALILLVLSLACTPVNIVFGFKQVLKLRRSLGLYGFLYASLHVLTFSVLDYGLDLDLIQQEIVEKRFILVGLAAFLLLIPLAITSTKGWMKRLGKNWKRLHWLAYLAVPLVVVHFVWLVKADIREPLRYGALAALLLLIRIPPVRRFLSGLRYRLRQKPDVVQRSSPQPDSSMRAENANVSRSRQSS